MGGLVWKNEKSRKEDADKDSLFIPFFIMRFAREEGCSAAVKKELRVTETLCYAVHTFNITPSPKLSRILNSSIGTHYICSSIGWELVLKYI